MTIKYEILEIEKGQRAKLLKCFSEKQTKKSNTVIVIIPGNPGLVDFFEHMAVELSELTCLPVMGISHTGHLFTDNSYDSWDSIGLADQIAHKIKFLEEHLQTDADLAERIDKEVPLNIVLVGHSIGCYVILEVLGAIRKDLKSKIKKCFLLFPAVERMSETPNGKKLTFLTRFFSRIWLLVSYLITCLPQFIHSKLIDVFFFQRHKAYVRKSNDDLVHNACSVVSQMCKSYSCARSMIHMAKDEMDHVKLLNTQLVRENSHLLLFYYGTIDKWAPISFYYEMKQLIDDGNVNNQEENNNNNNGVLLPNVILDPHGMEHSFVLFKRQSSTISKSIHHWVSQL